MGLKDAIIRWYARKKYREVMKMPIFQKLIGNNLAGVVGVLQALVPLLREFLIVGIRLFDVLFPGTGLEPLIIKVKEILTKVENGVEWVKNTFLGRVTE